MPEGKLRSGVYRSFLICDDPRGVVECGTIKKQSKSRNICSNNQRFDHPKKPKERSEDVDASRSSLQHLRVSKKVQKLNVVIDSWSKGLSYEAMRPEDIAKDLLRGALDLEESLAMLSSIQEDDIKQKRRISKDGRHDLRFQRSLSDRFGERIEKRMMIQENVTSRDCYDELRKVIKESFLRQNLLPQTKTTEIVRRDFTSSSTSSSQSSMVSSSTKSSASSDIPRRAPNLIARLMGLDVSTQEPSKSTVHRVDDKVSLERQEQLKKSNKKESAETVRCNSTREAVSQIPNENPSAIVQIRPMRVVKPEKEEKPVNKRPVLPRMQGEVHPRMINQRKDYQAMEVNKRSSNKMKLPPSLSRKDREPKGKVRKVEENEGKVIKLMSPSNVKAVTRESKQMETNKKHSLKKLENGEGKDRYRPPDQPLKPPNKPVTLKKSNSSSDMSRNKVRRSSSSSSEQRSSTREKKSGEASRATAKKKLHKQENDLASENNSGSSQDTLGSINQLSSEETTSSEFHIQGHCDNGEVSSSPAAIQHHDEPKPSQISLKSFLSSSSDYISYAENLFDFNTNTKRSQESALENKDSIVISDQRLALDFAKEVAKRKSLLLLTEPTCPQRSSLHIDELLREVCNGFESLRSYRDTFLGQSSFVKESIHMVLEKDLESKKTDMMSGVWDLGWRSEFLINETHQAVVDLEKLILSGLIQEIIS